MIYRIPFFDNNRRQTAATREGIIPYACHTVRNCDGSQAAATREGIIPYVRPSRDDHLFQRNRNIVGIVVISPCAEYISEVRIRRSILCRPNKRNGHGCQAGATTEGTPYARHAVRNSDRRQAGAILEGIPPYTRHTVPYGNGRQSGATIEGISIYCIFRHFRAVICGEPVGERDRRFFTVIAHEIAVCPVIEEAEAVRRVRKP